MAFILLIAVVYIIRKNNSKRSDSKEVKTNTLYMAESDLKL